MRYREFPQWLSYIMTRKDAQDPESEPVEDEDCLSDSSAEG